MKAYDSFRKEPKMPDHKEAVVAVVAVGGPPQASYEIMMKLLGQLLSLKLYAWTAHWNAKGEGFYGDHLLFERIYSGAEELIDSQGEHILDHCGHPVDCHEMLRIAMESSKGGEPFQDLMGIVQEAQATCKEALMEGEVSPQMEAYLTELADKLSEYSYLIGRRLS